MLQKCDICCIIALLYDKFVLFEVKMYILAIDTTAKISSVCLAQNVSERLVPVAQFDVNCGNTHSETVLPMINDALTVSKVDISEVSAFAVTSGPGSFTGVRIGVSTIKGLAFGLKNDVPCVPVSTLYALAKNVAGYGDDVIVCPLMDARREQFYNALFVISDTKLERLCDDRVITADELTRQLSEEYADKKIVICGDGAYLYNSLYTKYINEVSPHIVLAQAGNMLQNAFSVASAAFEIISEPDFDLKAYDSAKLFPTYLRLSQAERELNEKKIQAEA